MTQGTLVATQDGARHSTFAVTHLVVHVHTTRLVVVAAEDTEGDVFLRHELAAALDEDKQVEPHQPIHGHQWRRCGRQAGREKFTMGRPRMCARWRN